MSGKKDHWRIETKYPCYDDFGFVPFSYDNNINMLGDKKEQEDEDANMRSIKKVQEKEHASMSSVKSWQKT